jgi:hypothetical protein
VGTGGPRTDRRHKCRHVIIGDRLREMREKTLPGNSAKTSRFRHHIFFVFGTKRENGIHEIRIRSVGSGTGLHIDAGDRPA